MSQQRKFLPIISRIISMLILLLNLYFVPLSIYIIHTRGGSLGYGLVALPITISINLFLIPCAISFNPGFNSSILLLIINLLGLLWTLMWFWRFVIVGL